MPKEIVRRIKVDGKKYNPIDMDEIDEDIAPVKELAKAYQSKNQEIKEKITGAKVVEDDDGNRVLLLTGFKTKAKDRSKRMVKKPGECDPENIVSGTRRRKNINYKDLSVKKGSSNTSSKNTQEKRLKVSERINKKKKTTTKKEEVAEDKENVENQMVDDEEATTEKKVTKKRGRKAKQTSKKPKKQQSDDEKEEEEEWTFALSKKNCELIEKIGGKVKYTLQKRNYKDDQPIPDAINAFISTKWSNDCGYLINKKVVGGNDFEVIKHEIFVLENEAPKWMEENKDHVILGESSVGLVAAKMSEAKEDFTIYIIIDAVEEGEEEVVFSMPLSKYLTNLKKVKIVEEEAKEEEGEQVVDATSTSSDPATSSDSISAELVEQSLAAESSTTDIEEEAINEKVDIMQD